MQLLKPIFLIFLLFLSNVIFAASKIEIDAEIDEALEFLYKESPAAKTLAAKAKGILVFPSIVKAGWVFGGSYGEGALLVNEKKVNYYNNISGSLGFQFGIEKRSEIIMFLEQSALDNFKKNDGWDGGADGSIAIATFGAGMDVTVENIKDPIISFIFSPKGLMVNASVEGTKITK
ncbi:MAG: YSC84-related protein, partial [Betaproteobacteria bacterium]